jgi:hypothetical protein
VQREHLARTPGLFFTGSSNITPDVNPLNHQKCDSLMTQPQEPQQSDYVYDPDALFPSFYTNTAVQLLAGHARWSVSGRLGDDPEKDAKAPIDMRALMTSGRIRGAWEISDSCLVTLDELKTFLPNAANNAFYLQAQTDGLMVLDIEKTCPPEIAAPLLGMTEALYSELSMSGKGYHLLLPLPSNFWDYPLAVSKKVLREEHGYYEILLDHWVTFTRNEVPAERYVDPEGVLPVAPAWAELYASLAELAIETPSVELDISAEKPEIPREEQILDLMTRQPPKRDLASFHGDYSRWEFSILGVLYNRLAAILVAVKDVVDHPYDEGDQAWLVYLAGQKIIPARDKHEEYRNGMPLLLNAAVSLVARRSADESRTQDSGPAS